MQSSAVWTVALTAALTAVVGAQPGLTASQQDLLRLLEHRRCQGCRLQDADLVHADLRDADLRQAQLQRANLSQARLDGANLQAADLRFISLQGASLRGANLKGARLEGADLRQADLSGALIDGEALRQAHWDQAVGIKQGQVLTHAELHNAGVRAARASRFKEAERFFDDAIRQQPLAAVSWLARGICRSEQGKTQEAASDLSHAANLYEQTGEPEIATEIKTVKDKLMNTPETGGKRGGNGKGMEAVAGAVAALKVLAPIAAKAFLPVPF